MVIYLKCIAAMERQIRYTEKYFVENKCNRQEKSGVRAENAWKLFRKGIFTNLASLKLRGGFWFVISIAEDKFI
jgi:hypothetical protein